MTGLTKRQHEIIEFIQGFITIHKYSPSYRDIMQHFGFTSPGTVYKHIQILKRKGLILSESKCSRSLVPLADQHEQTLKSKEIEIPFIGHISEKNPIETFSKAQTITVPRSFVPSSIHKTYALRARGDSLNEELIADGDLLLLESRQEVFPGETAVVLINKRECYIKRFYPDDQHIRLESYLSRHQPIFLPVEKLFVHGVLVGLLRFF